MASIEKQSAGATVNLVNLSKHFGPVKAVNSVCLEIKSGEFLTLLGPSGSGKTTILNMIAGFISPTSGEILINEIPVTELPPYERDIGLTFQNYALFPHMSVFKNISFPLRMRKVPEQEIRRRVIRALELVQLPEYGDRYPAQLSGGQQQRVALARSLVFNPSVLLMDEPLGALDKKLREHMQLEIKHIQEELGVTVIYVTHDQQEALTMSDRIAVMNFGRSVQVDVPSFLYEHPVDHFVADFIGESNFIHGIYEKQEGETKGILRTGSFAFLVPSCEVQPEQAMELVVRPEKIFFVGNNDVELGTNVIRGRIREVIYVGENTRYSVETELNQSMVIKHPNRRETQIRRKSDTVLIGWKAEDSSLVRKAD